MMPDYLVDFGAGTEQKWHTLVQMPGNDVHDRTRAICGAAPGLFDQKGDRRSLIDETQPALTIASAPVARIEKHATTPENPPAVGNQRAKPAHVEITPTRPIRASDTIGNIGSGWRMPKPGIGRIDGKFGCLRGNADSPVQQMKYAGRIHLEGVNTLSHGQ
jgi:hypothetical protein